MQLSRRTLLFTSAALATSTYGAPEKQLAGARTIVREIMAANSIPALSISVMRGNDLLWAEAFGKVDLELDVIATVSHRFRLGSVSKIITATLAAELAARGVVDLDATVANYLPDLPEQHRATSLRQLLTHRGGIRHYAEKDESLEAPGPIDRRRYLNNADILAVFINDPLVAKPGELVSYSTFGYTLASIVLESAAKLPFVELVQRDIATALGLTTLCADAPMSLVPNRVNGYDAGDMVRRRFAAFQGKWANIPQNNPAYK